ncbi:EAL domain-containing protein [Glaciecola sp. MH2013]|uniref:putative bifunctional diguanylate cyclase/phosphodiesterase n=1 Tax=Glaciecola sp. MH2013 TaxID=2785524 RepID=UPI00189E7953|nr:bifunctional diguanylate cyclase/phosphodiesterase [Glaciecola sp. MH2013]MBF7073377.1 EAL domain-containing protein [Glaciecola sp. MH2013]
MHDFVALIFASLVGVNIMCALFIIFLKRDNAGRQFAVVIAFCFLVCFFQYSTWQYHLSSDFASSILWLKIQTSLLYLVITPYFLIFAFWCGASNIKYYVYTVCPLVLVLFVHNLIAPYSGRFTATQAPDLIGYTVFGDETVYRLAGEMSAGALLFYVISFVVLMQFVFWLARSRGKLPSAIWNMLAVSLLLQVFAIVMSVLTQKGVYETVLLGGLSFTFLNIVCCLGYSNLVIQKNHDFDTLSYRTATLENILVSIATRTPDMTSDDYLTAVISKMQEASGASTGIILVYDGPAENNKVKTAVAIHRQRILDTISFSRDNIPKDFRDPNDTHIVTSGLMDNYPESEFYQNIRAQAMISVPMFTKPGEPVGVMSLYFTNPSTPDDSFLNIVKVCASRLAAEYAQELLVKELENIAYVDYQTKLPNLFQLNKVLKGHEREIAQSNESVILIKFDIDGFADLNRKIGFDGADEVLKTIARRLANYASEQQIIARTGGDEFTFMTVDSARDLNGIIEMHWQALKSIVGAKIKTNKGTFRLRCSAGSVIYPSQVPTDMDAMRCAEFALSQAKIKGKNRLQTFDSQMIESINRQKHIEKELRNELEAKNSDAMFLVYQPKVNLKGQMIGAEALSRWTHPELGVIPPLEFIPIAEACGLIDQLGFWCIEEVCQQLASWRTDGFSPQGRVGINVSAQQFDSGDFVAELLAITEKYNIAPSQLDLELTESSLMKNIDSSIKTITELREHQFSISLDDFGTGYSSLSYLKDLPLDYLKIDRSFVIDAENGTSLYLLQSILSIGKNMQLKTVAEGVEEYQQVELLNTLGCDYFQGYYFSRPLEAKAFSEWSFVTEKDIPSDLIQGLDD